MEGLVPDDHDWANGFFALETHILHPMLVFCPAHLDRLDIGDLQAAYDAWTTVFKTLPDELLRHRDRTHNEPRPVGEPYALETAAGVRLAPAWRVNIDKHDHFALRLWYRRLRDDPTIKRELQVTCDEPVEQLIALYGRVLAVLDLQAPDGLARALPLARAQGLTSLLLTASEELEYHEYHRALISVMYPDDEWAQSVYQLLYPSRAA